MSEKRELEFRAEGFNVFNHAQFFGAAAVEGNISSGSFGQAVSAMAPRLMQLALRYRFQVFGGETRRPNADTLGSFQVKRRSGFEAGSVGAEIG